MFYKKKDDILFIYRYTVQNIRFSMISCFQMFKRFPLKTGWNQHFKATCNSSLYILSKAGISTKKLFHLLIMVNFIDTVALLRIQRYKIKMVMISHIGHCLIKKLLEELRILMLVYSTETRMEKLLEKLWLNAILNLTSLLLL